MIRDGATKILDFETVSQMMERQRARAVYLGKRRPAYIVRKIGKGKVELSTPKKWKKKRYTRKGRTHERDYI